MKPEDMYQFWDTVWDDESMQFPKPGQVKKVQLAVKVFADGREVCNDKFKEGREEYVKRKRDMWERQGRRCCLEGKCPTCPGKLLWTDTTFEHEAGRGMGGSKRDDRIEVLGKDGKMRWINGAAHHFCNAWKMSRSIQYNEREGG